MIILNMIIGKVSEKRVISWGAIKDHFWNGPEKSLSKWTKEQEN